VSDVAELVSLVTFLVANDGISLRDAAKATQRTPQSLLEDLGRLIMCGVPPYSPSDYINYTLDGAGEKARVHIRFASHFSRPLNFAPQEVVALKYALEHFGRGAEPDAQRQIDELTRTLGEALHGRAHEAMTGATKGFVIPRQTERMRGLISTLSGAVEDQQLVEIEYYSAHRARLNKRTVHPFAVLEIGAHFYLYAYCSMAADTRHFRVDRIRNVNLLDVFFDEQPPRKRATGRMESLFNGTPKDNLVVSFDSQVAQGVIDEWTGTPGVEIKQLAGGRARVSMPLYNKFWAIGFVMSFGEHAKIVEPQNLRLELAETLKRSLEAHTR
jgi:proteasome accessory factor C